MPPIHRDDTADLNDFLAQRGFAIAPLTWEAASLANTPPLHHRDPVDRLLIATALTSGLPIIANDRAFAPNGVATVW